MAALIRLHFFAVLILFFFSGFAGLVLQVLWMRELALLFGSTAQAAGATLGAFFLGLAAGGAFWGRRSAALARPLRSYGLLEAAVAVSALLFFLLRDLFGAVYGSVYVQFGSHPNLILVVKLIIALLILFPPTFFMGGTLPVLSQYLVRTPKTLGQRVPLLYGLNTLGAAAGVMSAAFVFPQSFGYHNSYLATVGLITLIAGAALLLGGKDNESVSSSIRTVGAVEHEASSALNLSTIRALAFLSGFITLALEVLWTRMFAQVLQNSVYTFASVLLVFLVALALGSLVAGLLARGRIPVRTVVGAMMVAGALLTAVTPLVFFRITNGLNYLGGGSDWSGYLAAVLGGTAVTLMPAVMALGLVFPYLTKVCEPIVRSAGRTVGELVALNTLGAIAGALIAGFLLLDWLGLWRSIQLMAGVYLAAVLIMIRPTPNDSPRRASVLVAVPVIGFTLLISVLDSSRLPVVRIEPAARQESLYQVWEGSSGTVAVVRRGNDLRTKVNNYYTLGGSAGRGYEYRQAHFPLMLHPDPNRVFFLGMGTGITAGGALAHPVDRVVVAELLPEVIEASSKYFRPYTNGLFDDPRVTIIAEDGRLHLAATAENYDVIIGDLFIPWRAGVGGLYTLEHFRNVRNRLAPGGLFAQWIPLYQLSEQEFGTIARSFLKVFRHTRLWRGDFLPDGPIVALVGHTHEGSLEVKSLQARGAIWQDSTRDSELPDDALPILLYYAGNLSRIGDLFDNYPLNTDDKPVIELQAPITHRAQAAGRTAWLTGRPLLDLFEEIATRTPWDSDPYLAGLTTRQRDTVRAGLAIFRSQLLQRRGDEATANAELAHARALLNPREHRSAETAASAENLRRELEALKSEYQDQLKLLEQRINQIRSKE